VETANRGEKINRSFKFTFFGLLDESTAFYKALKADASLSEEDKKAKSKEYSNDVRNPKLNEVIGEAKSKAFREAQKAQKEAAAAAKQ
jgi:hypothetical protein